MRTVERQQYLSNLANTMIQQLQIPETGAGVDYGAKLFEVFGNKVRTKVVKMTPETRGRIAELGLSDFDHSGISMFRATGIGNLNCRNHCGSWLMIELATMTIVAKMYEILCAKAYEQHRKDTELEEDEREFEEVCGRRPMRSDGTPVPR